MKAWIAATVFAAAALAACNKAPTPAPAKPAAAPAAASKAFDSLRLAQKPEGGTSITEARVAAKPGDSIIVSGEIGGRKQETFNPALATFFLVDPAVVTNCRKKHMGGEDDGCPTPWDYCCEPRAKLLAAMAFVQVKEPGSDKVAAQSLQGWNGLKELSVVTVVGKVDASSTLDSLVINAEGIYIEPAAAPAKP